MPFNIYFIFKLKFSENVVRKLGMLITNFRYWVFGKHVYPLVPRHISICICVSFQMVYFSFDLIKLNYITLALANKTIASDVWTHMYKYILSEDKSRQIQTLYQNVYHKHYWPSSSRIHEYIIYTYVSMNNMLPWRRWSLKWLSHFAMWLASTLGQQAKSVCYGRSVLNALPNV